MPRNQEIKKVLVIGSGPIVIGQAAEFDYAGTQACRSPVSYTHLRTDPPFAGLPAERGFFAYRLSAPVRVRNR